MAAFEATRPCVVIDVDLADDIVDGSLVQRCQLQSTGVQRKP